ncbi:MAG: hypothetical protein J5I93_04810 [Pirellulaceae bacterium]|nr:hypothetical protein [Pirellulaceae bacterium]
MPELKKLFQETTAGKLAADEQIRPLLGQLWASATEAFQPIEDELGLSLDELTQVPQGEFCVALVAPDQGRPALVMLLDVADKREAADKLLERADRAMTDSGAVKTVETHREVELRVYQFAGDAGGQVVQFEREGLIAMVTNLELAKAVLDVWDGQREDAQTLADNRKFTAIMKRSAGTREERPQLAWYVDPLELARRAGRGNFSFQAVLALFDPLGLDGLQAVGGSVILGSEEFDSIVHLHVSLATPREGVLDVLAMQSGDTTPEAWVPRDAASYMTMHWDLEQSYAAIEEVYDLVRGEGEWGTMVQQQVSDRLGTDLRNNLVGAMRGRISMLTWMEKPARLNSQSRIIGMQLKDPAAFRATLDDIMNKFADNWDKRSYGGQAYFALRVPEGGPRGPGANGSGDRRPLMRDPELLVAVQDDYVLLSDSTKLLEHVIQTRSNPSNSLADELEFKLVASKIKRHAGGEKPGMIYFDRPEEGMRLLYDLVTGDATRQRLGQAAESNGFFQALNNALNDNPLPPFHQIARYLAPRGGMVINDSTGIHYTMFGMRRETK